MLDQTIDLFTKHIKEIVVKDQRMDNIPLAYLMTLDIPDSLKHFFNQEVEMWLREEEEKFVSMRFDYDQPQVRVLIDKIFDLLSQNAFFDLNRFNQLLERAIKLQLNFIVKPHRTLKQFIFRNSDDVSTMEVYDTLKYFSHFDYYKMAISDYFNSKYLHNVTSEQFSELIDNIDDDYFEENKLAVVLETVKAIMASIGEARQDSLEKLSVDILYDALSDRNLDEFTELVQQVKYETAFTELGLDEIETLLKEHKLPDEHIAEIEPPESAFSSYETHEDITTATEESTTVDDSTSIELEESTELEFASSLSPVDGETQAGSVANDLADHVARQMQSDSPLEDINEMVQGRMRRKIIKKLFKKKEDAFLGFLHKLNTESSWKAASRIIDDVFYSNEINPYSKEAINLSDIIYLRFFPKDKYVGDKSEDMKW